MVIKVSKLVRQDVTVRDDVERFFSKLLLHLHHVGNKFGLVSELKAVREMIDSLVLVQ